MAYEENMKCMSRDAGEDLTASQYRFVKASGGKVVRCTTAGEAALGVVQNQPILNEAAAVSVDGSVTKIIAGAAITVDAKITTDNQGRAVTATTGNAVLGTALIAAATAGEVISIFQKGAPAVV